MLKILSHRCLSVSSHDWPRQGVQFRKGAPLLTNLVLDNQIPACFPGIPSSEVPVLLDTADIFPQNYDLPRSLIEAIGLRLMCRKLQMWVIPCRQ